jgi:hypothetical protein
MKNYDSLREYVENDITKTKDDPYYDENFIWAIQEYFGSKGEFTENDIQFIHDNGLSEDDFVDEEYDSYEDYMSR